MTSKEWSLWERNFAELIRRTSSNLPRDVESRLRRARNREDKNSPARWALDAILENARLARERSRPICQDTGALLFYLKVPSAFDIEGISGAIRSAVALATELGHLRENTIDTATGASRPTNVGEGAPAIHFERHSGTTIEARLLMKGGGSENVSAQYSLPDTELKADRDWTGVYKCAMHAVWKAQGMGCAPGFLGICVGGDRASGADWAKRQFLRPLNDKSPNKNIAKIEKMIYKGANELGIGPMGFGGATTIFGVKIGTLSRLPASFFVSIAYMCWAFRRGGMIMNASSGRILKWLDQS
jgi:fumarate hydratase, class I